MAFGTGGRSRSTRHTETAILHKISAHDAQQRERRSHSHTRATLTPPPPPPSGCLPLRPPCPWRAPKRAVGRRRRLRGGGSKGFALTWYRALTWYSSPARPFAVPDDPRLVTGQQGSPSPACQQLSRARTVCAGGSSEGSTKLKHGTKLGRTLAMRSAAAWRAWRALRPAPGRHRHEPATHRSG